MLTVTEREKLRAEHNKRVISGEYKEKLGCTCVNCGSTEEIEYHHIVPLCMGGTNRISNIAPVCKNCHVAIHGEAEYRKLAFQKAKRKPKPKSEDFERVFWQYAKCEIGITTAKGLLGMSPKAGLKSKKEYQIFLYRNKIKKIVNHVEKYKNDDNWPPESSKSVIGYIVYEDGDIQEIQAKDVFEHYNEPKTYRYNINGKTIYSTAATREALIASMPWEG